MPPFLWRHFILNFFLFFYLVSSYSKRNLKHTLPSKRELNTCCTCIAHCRCSYEAKRQKDVLFGSHKYQINKKQYKSVWNTLGAMKEMHGKAARGRRIATGGTAEHWTLSYTVQRGDESTKSQSLLGSTGAMGDRVPTRTGYGTPGASATLPLCKLSPGEKATLDHVIKEHISRRAYGCWIKHAGNINTGFL